MAEGWLGRVTHPDGYDTFSCPAKYCYYHVRLGPVTDEQHNCPHLGVTTHGWSITVGLVEQIWQKLDKVVDEMKHEPKPTDLAIQNLRGQAEAYAESLVLFMAPLYNSVEDISREAGRRYKARKAGNLDYTTPGIGHAKFKTMMDGDVWYRSATGGWTSDPNQASGPPAISDDALLNSAHGIIAIALETNPLRVGGAHPIKSSEELKRVEHNFTDEEVAKIKAFAENGFTAEDLARIHGVKVSVMRSVLGS